MQKYFSFLFVLLSINALRQTPTAGRLKVTIESFKCINKSWDGFVEFDGHGNEVSVNFSYSQRDKYQRGNQLLESKISRHSYTAAL